METPEAAQQLSVRTVWPTRTGGSARPANQFAVAPATTLSDGAPDQSLYLMVGHVAPPMIPGPSEFQAFIDAGAELEIDVVAELVLTPGRARELWEVLGNVLREIDETQ